MRLQGSLHECDAKRTTVQIMMEQSSVRLSLLLSSPSPPRPLFPPPLNLVASLRVRQDEDLGEVAARPQADRLQ